MSNDKTILDGSTDVSLKDILMFLTGTDEVPPCGFDVKPALKFTEYDRMPESITCTITLTLSLVHTNYEVFKAKMDFATPNGYGFGKI